MPARAFQGCHSILSWWMVIFIGLLMLNEPCSSCLNWMLFMFSRSALSSSLSLSLPSPSLTPSTESHQPLLLHRPSFPFLVCEVGRRRLMNKGSLTSHAFYEASGGTQTNNDAHRNAHLLTHNTHNTNSGDGKRERERPAESLSQLKCWLFFHRVGCIFFWGKNHQQVHAHGAELVLEMPSSLRHSPH